MAFTKNDTTTTATTDTNLEFTGMGTTTHPDDLTKKMTGQRDSGSYGERYTVANFFNNGNNEALTEFVTATKEALKDKKVDLDITILTVDHSANEAVYSGIILACNIKNNAGEEYSAHSVIALEELRVDGFASPFTFNAVDPTDPNNFTQDKTTPRLTIDFIDEDYQDLVLSKVLAVQNGGKQSFPKPNFVNKVIHKNGFGMEKFKELVATTIVDIILKVEPNKNDLVNLFRKRSLTEIKIGRANNPANTFSITTTNKPIANKKDRDRPNKMLNNQVMISNIGGYIDFDAKILHEPNQTGQVAQRHSLTPLVIINELGGALPDISTGLIGLLSASVMTQNDNWLRGTVANLDFCNPAVVESLDGKKVEKLNKLTTPPAKIHQKLKQVCDGAPQMFLEMTDGKSLLMDIFYKAAAGDPVARLDIVKAANKITDGIFPTDYSGELFYGTPIQYYNAVLPIGKNGKERSYASALSLPALVDLIPNKELLYQAFQSKQLSIDPTRNMGLVGLIGVVKAIGMGDVEVTEKTFRGLVHPKFLADLSAAFMRANAGDDRTTIVPGNQPLEMGFQMGANLASFDYSQLGQHNVAIPTQYGNGNPMGATNINFMI